VLILQRKSSRIVQHTPKPPPNQIPRYNQKTSSIEDRILAIGLSGQSGTRLLEHQRNMVVNSSFHIHSSAGRPPQVPQSGMGLHLTCHRWFSKCLLSWFERLGQQQQLSGSQEDLSRIHISSGNRLRSGPLLLHRCPSSSSLLRFHTKCC
jgi:hypothetical protein